MLQAVLWDMDGLMFDTERIGQAGWQAAARELGIDIPPEVVAAMRGTGTDACRRLFNRSIPGNYYDKAHALRLQYAADWVQRHGVPVKPGLRPLLDGLRDRGIPSVLATSTARATALAYLEQAGVCFGTPLERLLHMNKPAVDFYLDRGVDLAKQPLEIALCAQHNNGGLAVDCWWQTEVWNRTTTNRLFPASSSSDHMWYSITWLPCHIPRWMPRKYIRQVSVSWFPKRRWTSAWTRTARRRKRSFSSPSPQRIRKSI